MTEAAPSCVAELAEELETICKTLARPVPPSTPRDVARAEATALLGRLEMVARGLRMLDAAHQGLLDERRAAYEELARGAELLERNYDELSVFFRTIAAWLRGIARKPRVAHVVNDVGLGHLRKLLATLQGKPLS